MPALYYRDSEDTEFEDSYFNFHGTNVYINHQYYNSTSSSPYFEGSFLLAQSAMDNHTAVYEAFDSIKETGFSEIKVPFTYQVYNDFFQKGYHSVMESEPDEWALEDLDGDGVPEIIFMKVNDGWMRAFEVYYYNNQTGTVEFAGSISEYCERLIVCPDKHLLGIDGSLSSFQNWDAYSYANHSIDWSFSLSATTDHGSTPRLYTIVLTDKNGQQELGKYEYYERDKIWDEYFGAQVEVEFDYFTTRGSWNLPEGVILPGE